jgi:8-oxo-dGTP diphosphatase
MSDRTNFLQAVLIVIQKDDKVLLHKRKNTGWMDGWYDVPSGHVESKESIPAAACREILEETGIKISNDQMKLVHISQADAGNGKPYTYFVFKADKWEGEPVLKEPQMAEAMNFYPIDNLPPKIPPYTKSGILNSNSTVLTFSYFGPENF